MLGDMRWCFLLALVRGVNVKSVTFKSPPTSAHLAFPPMLYHLLKSRDGALIPRRAELRPEASGGAGGTERVFWPGSPTWLLTQQVCPIKATPVGFDGPGQTQVEFHTWLLGDKEPLCRTCRLREDHAGPGMCLSAAELIRFIRVEADSSCQDR